MRSSQNLSAQHDAGAARSPDWVLTSPRSFGSMKDGKVIGVGYISVRLLTLTPFPAPIS